MIVKDTSLAAFFKDKTQQSISTLEARVLDSLYADGPGTRLDLLNRLDKPINYITAPVLNLIKAGKVRALAVTTTTRWPAAPPL